jgi:hypothetical protein
MATAELARVKWATRGADSAQSMTSADAGSCCILCTLERLGWQDQQRLALSAENGYNPQSADGQPT